MKISAKILIITAIATMALVSCGKENKASDDSRKVMILYSAGYNSLSSYLRRNIQELQEGWLPTKKTGQDVVLIVSKPLQGSYANQTSPVLIRMYKSGSSVIMDTVKVYTKGRSLVEKESFQSILQDIKSMYPAASYGMIFSSHATGWLPSGYYANPYAFENSGQVMRKTIGQEVYIENSVSRSQEMEVEDMASAIPYKLDYLLIDACLGGCVEVAYAFRDKVNYIGFSPAEVLTEGFDYTKIARQLLQAGSPANVCSDYIERYLAKTGDYKSATISLVEPAKMGSLVSVCKQLTEKYRTRINSLDYVTVQEYGGTKHWFFDLEDIFLKAGITTEEARKLEDALNECVVYKDNTGQYYSATDGSTHEITIYSGLAMYLPSVDGDYLHNFYKSLSWNKAVELVK